MKPWASKTHLQSKNLFKGPAFSVFFLDDALLSLVTMTVVMMVMMMMMMMMMMVLHDI